jgi:hypothetical protein
MIVGLIWLAVLAQAFPQTLAKRRIPCKTAGNAASCYWTRGRLSLYNGNPPWRLWKVATHRILAIYSGPATWQRRDEQDSENPEFPINLGKVYRSQVNDPSLERVFADFEICPLERERSGQMQSACIESAKNIFVQK